MTKSEVDKIIETKDTKDKNYQVACLRLFEFANKNGVSENIGNHPNSFFSQAVQYQKDVKKAEEKKKQMQSQQQSNQPAVAKEAP